MLTAITCSPSFLLLQAYLQLFQTLPNDVGPLVWTAAGKSEDLQSLLGLLLEVAWGKVPMPPGRDGAACAKEQSSATLPGCFLLSPPCLQRQPLRLGCPGDPAELPARMWGSAYRRLCSERRCELCLCLPCQALSKETRLLAGTALSMLAGTAPQPRRGASALLALCHLPHQGACPGPSWGRAWQGQACAGVRGQRPALPTSSTVSSCQGLGAQAGTGCLPRALRDEAGAGCSQSSICVSHPSAI